MAESKIDLLIGISFICAGLIMLFIPNQVFILILLAAILLSFGNCILLVLRFAQKRNKMDLVFSFGSLLFALFLYNHHFFPQWVMRVGFGAYCIIYSICTFIQWGIYFWNANKRRVTTFFHGLAFLFLALFLLFYSDFQSYLIMMLLGVYVLLLGFRYVNDAMMVINPGQNASWSRKYRLSLPVLLSAFLPDWAISYKKNHETKNEKNDKQEPTNLRLMVHVGPKGFQKVGHITVVFNGMVYSYGNYNKASQHLNGTVGNGVFFIAPYEKYLPMILSNENNSIFEYGVKTTAKQDTLIAEKLQYFKDISTPWHAPIESSSHRLKLLKDDYANRLKIYADANFYQIESGRFKTYWALGVNCALFIDSVLKALESDLLTLQGIFSPGLYFDWLEKEYAKANSPIISRWFYSMTVK